MLYLKVWPYQKAIKMSRIIHRDSWKPEIKLLSASSQAIHIILNGNLDIYLLFLFSSEKPFENMEKKLIKLKLLPDIRKRRDFSVPFF